MVLNSIDMVCSGTCEAYIPAIRNEKGIKETCGQCMIYHSALQVLKEKPELRTEHRPSYS